MIRSALSRLFRRVAGTAALDAADRTIWSPERMTVCLRYGTSVTAPTPPGAALLSDAAMFAPSSKSSGVAADAARAHRS